MVLLVMVVVLKVVVMEVMEELEEMVLELEPCQYGEVKSGSATRGPDCVVLSRNNTTDGLSRFWVAPTSHIYHTVK